MVIRADVYSKAVPDMTSPAASGRYLSRFEKLPKMPYLTALFAGRFVDTAQRLCSVNGVFKFLE